MKDKKAVPIILVLGVILSWAIMRLLEASHLMPVSAAAEAEDVDHAFRVILNLSAVIYGFVSAYLVYALVRFRATEASQEGAAFDATPGHKMEKAWIIASLALTLGLAAFGSEELHELISDPRADLDVQISASQFSWEFYYPAQDQYGSRLFLPKGKRVRLLLTSKDVVHSFWVPEFRLKQDALPGRMNHLILTPTREGVYELRCSELCGTDHTTMTSFVEVVPPEEFESKLGGESW